MLPGETPIAGFSLSHRHSSPKEMPSRSVLLSIIISRTMFHELRLSMEALAYSPKCPGFAKNIIYKVRLKSLRSGHITIMPSSSGGRVHLEPCACHGGPAVNQEKLITSEEVFVICLLPKRIQLLFQRNGPLKWVLWAFGPLKNDTPDGVYFCTPA